MIAVLMCCFNRRVTTLRCLTHVFRLVPSAIVYLVDDNSTDGTAEAVSALFPQVHLINGGGDLYWNRGMHLAWSHAMVYGYPFYLWLNDDVILYDGGVAELLACSAICQHQAIISGIIEAHDGQEVLYGGTDSTHHLLVPNETLQPITNMNGNVLLVPASVFAILGNLDPYFHHDLGDVDYGLRGRQHGIQVLTSRVAVGSGDKNNLCRVRLWGTDVWQRFKKLYSPLGSHPRVNFYFRRRHYGLHNAVIYYVFIHLLNIMPDSLVRLVFDGKYVPD